MDALHPVSTPIATAVPPAALRARAAREARYDGPSPAAARMAASCGSARAFEVSRARANAAFFKGHVRASMARLRRTRRLLGDPTLPASQVARLEERLAGAVTDLRFGLRQFRAHNRHFWRLARGQGARTAPVAVLEEPVPRPVPPEHRLLRRPTHTVDDGTRFWLFATRAEADAFAAAQTRRHAGRVFTLSELATLAAYGRRAAT